MKLNKLFSDGAVFQRRIPVPVFGWTDPDSMVEITFNGRQFCGMAGKDGVFLIRLAAMEAGGPYTMQVRNTRTGDTAEVADILVGEVWLASGQSNMEYPINASPEQHREFMETVTADGIRMFTVPKRASTVRENDISPVMNAGEEDTQEFSPGAWILEQTPVWKKAIGSQTCRMSAVALWFAKKLHETLNVPVGILSSSWGGTIVEAWTSMEMLRTNPDIAADVAAYEAELSQPDRWSFLDRTKPFGLQVNLPEQTLIEKYCIPDPPDAGSPQGWAGRDFDDSAWADFSIPDSWILHNFCKSGVVWARCSAEIPVHWAGKDLELHLGGIDKHDITFFNGTQVGRTGCGFEWQHWDRKRCYTVPGNLVAAGKNVIAVRAYSFIYDGSFNGESADYYLQLPGTDERISFAGACKLNVEQDFNFSGLPAAAMGPLNPNSYSILFDSMIAPLIPYGIRGAIWYQGESNAKNPEPSRQYERKMCDMIRDWRFRWGIGDFPFIQTCLAFYTAESDYNENDNWAELRNAQRKVLKDLPNNGIASALDVGDAANIHPEDKKTVGTRMALWALENTYAVPGICGSGPEIRNAVQEQPGVVRLTFDHCAEKLVAKDGVLKGFYVAGSDQTGGFIRADSAVLEGNSVLVSSSRISNIQRVRYAWSINPVNVVTLYNSAGLPASPFEINVSI